ncbi:MAG TPA: hypothetical protein VK745_10690, partial [Polyangiaceae bacterium]|nr:hypothetical protein [Polyangiaceae bacterium]
MRSPRSRLLHFAGLVLFSTGLTVGCAQLLGLKEDVPAAPCVLNSDCAPSELCIFRVCSEACKLDKDCAAGSRCLDTNGAAACVQSATAECGVDAGDSTCPDQTVCDANHVCRNACADCHADQVCTAGVCVGTDPNHDPGAPASAGSGGAVGTGGNVSTGGSVSAGGKTGSGGATTGGASTTGGAVGTGGAPVVTTCGDTAVGDTTPCSELPDGTPITFPGGMPQGPCALGSKLCQSDGNFGPCMGAVAPVATDCMSALDKNCNGQADNSECGVCTAGATQYCYDAPAATSGVGACKPGTQVCQLDMASMKTIWGTCAGEVTPAVADTCDSGNDATCN